MALTLCPSLGRGVPPGPLQKAADRRNRPCRFMQSQPERSAYRLARLAQIRHAAVPPPFSGERP